MDEKHQRHNRPGNARFMVQTARLALALVAAAACGASNGSGEMGGGGGGGGGAGAGGSAAGGAGAGGTGGSGAGGTAAGGSGAGGSAAGGSGAGGTATGGSATGGSGVTDGGATDASIDSSAVCATAAGVTTYPALPGATMSPLYTVTANGTTQFVEKLTKFTPEMQVHYAHFSVANGCSASVSVTLSTSFDSFTVSPKSRNISATKSGNTITFTSAPNYLILQFDTQELLFILIDSAEMNPPKLGDADVKSIMDYSVDATGATLMTSKIQSAINAASGATQNILYFPPGKYLVGEIWPKSNMTIYLAGGAILQGSSNTSDFNTGSGGLTVENDSHGLMHFLNVTNTQLLGRGVIDGNGVALRTSVGAGGAGATGATGAALINTVKIDASTNILIDGITSRDSSFWNTLIYESNMVTIQNYKVINQRPITTTYNQTDGVDFDATTMGTLTNAFLYTGDDNMATKCELNANQNTNGILHQHVVTYSNSGACKIGTKTGGTVMNGIVWDDIDVVKAGRAMAVDGYDTAVVQNTIWENIRVEAADTNLIDIDEDMPPTWRTAANLTVTNSSTFQNVTSAVNALVSLHGKSSTVDINGVHFIGLTVAGQSITSQPSSWRTQFVVDLTFQ
jgi:hypothetical protein